MNPKWQGKIDGDHFDPTRDCGFRAITGPLAERTLAIRNPKCLSPTDRAWVTLNEALGSLGLGFECQSNGQIGELAGHINWFPVTATGRLEWVGYAPDYFGDGDLTMNFFTPGPNATTVINASKNGARAYHIEFFRREILDKLPTSPNSLWGSLKANLRNSDALAGLIDDRFAIVTGTFNLDGVHRLHAELHPVLAIAVLLDETRDDDLHTTEHWAIMARNSGNQGDCSNGSLQLLPEKRSGTMQQFTLDLGWAADATDAEVVVHPDYSTAPSAKPVFSTRQKHCACLEFRQLLPTTLEERTLFMGTIDLKWTKRDKDAKPLTRLQQLGWTPAGFGAMKVVPIPKVAEQVRVENAPVSAPGGRTLRSADSVEEASASKRQKTNALREMSLDALDTSATTKPTNTRVYRSTPLLESRPVLPLDCGRFPHRDPLCLGGSRWTPFIGFDASSSKLTEGVSLYFYPHALPALGDVFSTAGYRFDGRYDLLRRRESDGFERPRQGAWVGEASIVYQPGSRRITDRITLSPYSFVGPGVVHLKDQTTAFQIQRGVGLETRITWVDLAVEYRHSYYFGKIAENTIYSMGWLLHIP